MQSLKMLIQMYYHNDWIPQDHYYNDLPLSSIFSMLSYVKVFLILSI